MRRGIQSIVVAKSTDAVTTAIGLLFFPLAEANPMGRRLMATFGLLPGILLASVLAVAIVILVTEGSAGAIKSTEKFDGHDRSIRLLGYGGTSVIWVGVAIHNLGLIIGTV